MSKVCFPLSSQLQSKTLSELGQFEPKNLTKSHFMEIDETSTTEKDVKQFFFSSSGTFDQPKSQPSLNTEPFQNELEKTLIEFDTQNIISQTKQPEKKFQASTGSEDGLDLKYYLSQNRYSEDIWGEFEGRLTRVDDNSFDLSDETKIANLFETRKVEDVSNWEVEFESVISKIEVNVPLERLKLVLDHFKQ
ncbi:hypothetical protein HK096_007363 [Nowakowskiella sp. JEL0078]|nr:hypothetical protein HK096_007363 [Nowakowskiella sp. JEL0078]